MFVPGSLSRDRRNVSFSEWYRMCKWDERIQNPRVIGETGTTTFTFVGETSEMGMVPKLGHYPPENKDCPYAQFRAVVACALNPTLPRA